MRRFLLSIATAATLGAGVLAAPAVGAAPILSQTAAAASALHALPTDQVRYRRHYVASRRHGPRVVYRTVYRTRYVYARPHVRRRRHVHRYYGPGALYYPPTIYAPPFYAGPDIYPQTYYDAPIYGGPAFVPPLVGRGWGGRGGFARGGGGPRPGFGGGGGRPHR